MSEQTRYTILNRVTLSACAVAMTAVVLAATPALAKASETATHDAKCMPSESMDHSKMDGMSMTGDTDYDYAANMRMHHQKAVEMSEAQLKNGKNAQTLDLAKDIIAEQKAEIVVLDQWLETHKKP